MLYLSFMSVARFHFDSAAGRFHQNPAGCDVPQADSLFDVSVETSAGDISHVERGAAHAGGICARDGPFLEERKTCCRSSRRFWKAQPR